MVTKNIKKILLNKGGNNFVADIEDIENKITQNSSNLETVKQELSNKCNEALSEAKAYTDTEKAKYLPLTGGTVTGLLNCTASNATADVNNKELTSYVADIMGANAQLSIIKGDGTTSVLSINNVLNATNATNATNAKTADSATSASSATNATNLGGYPASNYVRSVNGVKASENGNVTIPLPFVKTVNSTAPDSNGNVVLDLSSSGGGIGFPNFSAGVAISNFNGRYDRDTTRTYTLPSSGWVMGDLIFSPGSTGCSVSIYLNNALQKSFSSSSKTVDYDFSVSLKSGTQIKMQINNPTHGNIDVSSSLRFYPFLS